MSLKLKLQLRIYFNFETHEIVPFNIQDKSLVIAHMKPNSETVTFLPSPDF